MNMEDQTPDAPFLSEEMIDMFRKISEANEENIRLCRTLLAGFKVTGEKDLDYMDTYLDSLFDLMEQGSEEEMLYRDYLSYMAKFNPAESRERLQDMEETLGYWSPVVWAAYLTAKELHKGQKDKGGNDYFTSHLYNVGRACFSWKEKVIGLLHDAAEDTPNDVESIIGKVKRQLDDFAKDSQNLDWYRIIPFDTATDLCPFPGDAIFFPSDDDWQEISDALKILNHHTASNREEYIHRIEGNMLALRVKLKDLENNMDMSRIPDPSPDDYARLERYKKEHSQLWNVWLKRMGYK